MRASSIFYQLQTMNKKKRNFQVVIEKKSDSPSKAPVNIETTAFELSETFKVPPTRLYEILTEPEVCSFLLS